MVILAPLYCYVLEFKLDGTAEEALKQIRDTHYTLPFEMNGQHMKFLTGVLNSKLIAFWLKHRGKMQGENYQLDKEPLLNIPLPLETCEQIPIINLVDRILSAKKANPLTDTTAEEREIDRLVYDLYGLTEDEIAIVEGTNS